MTDTYSRKVGTPAATDQITFERSEGNRVFPLRATRAALARVATATVAATGSTQANAAAIVAGFTLVTGADAAKGVRLPTAVAGEVAVVKNGAASVLKIWPATGDAINALSVDASFSIAASVSVYLVAYDATTWYSVPLLPS